MKYLEIHKGEVLIRVSQTERRWKNKGLRLSGGKVKTTGVFVNKFENGKIQETTV